jgi:hypothetical protein
VTSDPRRYLTDEEISGKLIDPLGAVERLALSETQT